MSMYKPTPDPVSVEWLRTLLKRTGCGLSEASRLLHCDDRTVRRWVAGVMGCDWRSAERLRRLIAERKPLTKGPV